MTLTFSLRSHGSLTGLSGHSLLTLILKIPIHVLRKLQRHSKRLKSFWWKLDAKTTKLVHYDAPLSVSCETGDGHRRERPLADPR